MDYKEAIVQVGIGILAESLVGAKVEGLAGARAISGAKAYACKSRSRNRMMIRPPHH